MNTASLSRFYPKYPLIDDSVFDPYKGVGFENAIVSKQEFANLKLNAIEDFPKNKGEYLRHQLYITRYMSVYDEILLFHEPGTGKTCTAVAAIENIRNSPSSTFKRAIICAKGDGLTDNFLQELVFKCTDGRYIPAGYDDMRQKKQNRRIKYEVNKFYKFKTFETFATSLSGMSNEAIRTQYEDSIFVLDEIHNIHDKDDENVNKKTPLIQFRRRNVNVYGAFHKIFHMLKRRKIILMSGTPMKDKPDEFAQVMNLILPANKQIAIASFKTDYFTNDGYFIEDKKSHLAEIIKGRVSYLNTVTTDVKKVYIGNQNIGNLRHFIVDNYDMSSFQTIAYQTALSNDTAPGAGGIYSASRQASLFVYPDSSFGDKGYQSYIESSNYSKFRSDLQSGGLALLEKYSCKYYRLMTYLHSLPIAEKHFVYCQFVTGSGLNLLANIMEIFGYQRYGSSRSGDTRKAKRFALCTGTNNTKIKSIVERFNREDNVNGEYISVILGSRIMNEGFTLKDIKSEWIMSPHWNYGETAQAIARGWRLGSHNYKLKNNRDVSVEIHQCVSIPAVPEVMCIDLYMYEIAEKKDVLNRQLERLVKETSFDCALAFDRNRVTGLDGQRECDYQSCDYVCSGSITSPVDKSTFNLLTDVQLTIRTKVLERLVKVFKIWEEYKLQRLLNDFNNEYDDDAIKQGVLSVIDDAELITDSKGFPKFLRCRNDVLFLSIDPVTASNTFSQFYSNVLQVDDVSFKWALDKVYEENMDKLTEQVFANHDMATDLIMKLPYRVQRMILEACILSRDVFRTNLNARTRDKILEFYKGLYGVRNDGKRYVWLHHDVIGSTCYNEDTKAFESCELDFTDRINELKRSPVGWYGLYNPAKNDFCMRDVADRDVANQQGKGGVDRRKLTVGQRCINYKQKPLSVIASRMQIGEGASDEERKAYWADKSKKQKCEAMKNWFIDNNLMETSFECGNSQKISRNNKT